MTLQEQWAPGTQLFSAFCYFSFFTNGHIHFHSHCKGKSNNSASQFSTQLLISHEPLGPTESWAWSGAAHTVCTNRAGPEPKPNPAQWPAALASVIHFCNSQTCSNIFSWGVWGPAGSKSGQGQWASSPPHVQSTRAHRPCRWGSRLHYHIQGSLLTLLGMGTASPQTALHISRLGKSVQCPRAAGTETSASLTRHLRQLGKGDSAMHQGASETPHRLLSD